MANLQTDLCVDVLHERHLEEGDARLDRREDVAVTDERVVAPLALPPGQPEGRLVFVHSSYIYLLSMCIALKAGVSKKEKTFDGLTPTFLDLNFFISCVWYFSALRKPRLRCEPHIASILLQTDRIFAT